MLEIKNVRSGYGNFDIVKNINLIAHNGELFCIAGPNGCGKTTLLKAIAALLRYKGSISVDGSEVSKINRKSIAKKIALLSQVSQVYFPYTVYDTVMQGRYAYHDNFFSSVSRSDKIIIEKTIDHLGLSNVQDVLINELSGGQLQRVFLARTLVQDPSVILLDEPTNHLDLKYTLELFKYLKAWVKETNKTVLGVFHDLNLIRNYADSCAIMKDGEIVCSGNCSEVFAVTRLQDVYGIDIQKFMIESLSKWQ
ncbi:MAG: ABC transporter ATP-binding protein [Termitinemataceae bacterium]|nr:MAG: ABC transporter ATP-binding protein [Termitinemataceae bacterium]